MTASARVAMAQPHMQVARREREKEGVTA